MGRPILSSLIGAAAAVAVLVVAVTPAGRSAPNVIRHVRLNGTLGPAYYSVVEGGFRPVVGAIMTAEHRPETTNDRAVADASR